MPHHVEDQPLEEKELDFDLRLQAYAEVVVRIGLNLQRGQRLMIAEPYELHGVAHTAEPLTEAVRKIAMSAGHLTSDAIEVIWSNPGELTELVTKKKWRALSHLAAANARRMNDCVQRGDALLFLLGSQPRLLEGIPAKQVAHARRIGNDYFSGVAQQLMQGATNWTAAPAPSPDWAEAAFSDLPAERRLPALWESLFASMRIPSPQPGTTPIAAWQAHLQSLEEWKKRLNAQRFKSVHYRGEGTNLTISLPPEHLWCTAAQRTQRGVPFVANLPTEEVFTLPHKDSANGTVRVARPVTFGGSVIEGIELEFKDGRVVQARAQTGESLLCTLLESDHGAARLGEVAIVPDQSENSGTVGAASKPSWARGRFFHHVLLDENAASHIALGEGYGFCLSSSNPAALNRSLLHIDLPIEATATLHH